MYGHSITDKNPEHARTSSRRSDVEEGRKGTGSHCLQNKMQWSPFTNADSYNCQRTQENQISGSKKLDYALAIYFLCI